MLTNVFVNKNSFFRDSLRFNTPSVFVLQDNIPVPGQHFVHTNGNTLQTQ